MKNIMFISIFALILIAGCSTQVIVNNFEECVDAGNSIVESFPRVCVHNGEVFTEEVVIEDKFEACEDLGGIALAEFNECEYISEEDCSLLEGEFLECESACRNDPEYPEVICTMQCVLVCSFN